MKNATQPATSKLVKKFDNELKNMIMADLKSFKAKIQFTTSPVMQLSTASAA